MWLADGLQYGDKKYEDFGFHHVESEVLVGHKYRNHGACMIKTQVSLQDKREQSTDKIVTSGLGHH